MKSQIQLHNKKVEYTLKHCRRARKVRLAVYCDGNFVVIACAQSRPAGEKE